MKNSKFEKWIVKKWKMKTTHGSIQINIQNRLSWERLIHALVKQLENSLQIHLDF